MQFKIKGEEKELIVRTVTLQPEETNNLYAFHCVTCGNFVQKIGGRVSRIYPLYEPSSDVPVLSRCKMCETEYTFQTQDEHDSEPVRVILHPDANGERTYFFCYRGKDPILEYTSNHIISLIDNTQKAIPFSSSCKNPTCSIRYYFADLY